MEFLSFKYPTDNNRYPAALLIGIIRIIVYVKLFPRLEMSIADNVAQVGTYRRD